MVQVQTNQMKVAVHSYNSHFIAWRPCHSAVNTQLQLKMHNRTAVHV